ncbi:MAG TPA: serine/threonine-protein kinase [Polyangia bacterium]|jgi:serine/threonine-protein kinase
MSDGESGHLSAGETFGSYQIVRMLGEGSMCRVYQAIHVGFKKRVAIKTLLPAISRNPEAQTRFMREAEAASRINHPNVVDVTDVGSERGIPYLVMEYLEGETLADLIERKGPLDLSGAVDLLLPSIAAVSAGHEQGVIHRDLKPQNVFIARGMWPEGTPKILDFGVSKILGEGNAPLTDTMAVMGTAAYMSPEQARGAKVVDAASDQYAVGLIFHEMLTAKRGHDGDSPLAVLHAIMSGHVPDAGKLRPDLPPAVLAVSRRMLAVNPRERFPSLRAAARELLPYANERPRLTYADSFREPGDAPPNVATDLRPLANRPGSGSKPGRTKLLPSMGGAGAGASFPVTTLGQSAVGRSSFGARRSRMPVLLVVGGVVVAGVLVVAVLGREGARDPHVDPPAAPVAAAPALPTPGTELPHPPAPPPVVRAPPPLAIEPKAGDKHGRASLDERRPSRGSGKSAPHGGARAEGGHVKAHRGNDQTPIID